MGMGMGMGSINKSADVSFKFPRMLLILLFLAHLVLQTQFAESQQDPAVVCPRALANLNVCAPFLVPGAVNNPPSTECCGAVQAVPHDCICTTLQIASRLPSRCNVPILNCSAAN